MDVRAVLADVAGLGPFFTVGTDPAEVVDPSWRPMVDLYAPGSPSVPGSQPLRDRIAQVRHTLGSDGRVAASIAFQGLAALIVSAPFAAVVRHGVLPALTPHSLHWRPAAGGPWPLWCAAPAKRPVADLAGALLDEHLTPLVAAVQAQVPIAERILWGSVASSVASAKRLVGGPAAAEVAALLLATGPLAGSGELLVPQPPDRHWTFRRRSCCLYYRVPGGGLCGDCVLHARGR